MTKRRYRSASRMSRSGTPTKKTPPTAQHPPLTGPNRSRARPFGHHYRDLQPESEPHPIDLIVDRAREVVTLRPKLWRLLDAVKKNSSDLKLFIAYEDTRLAQAAVREALFFDAGYECGQVTGHANSIAASASGSSAGQELRRRVYLAALKLGLPERDTVAVLLQLARAYVVGLDLFARPRKPGSPASRGGREARRRAASRSAGAAR